MNGIAVESAFLQGGEVVRLGDVALAIEAHPTGDRPALPAVDRFGRLVGGSLPMRRLYPLLSQLATADFPVVIEGETGTGKELLAEVLHETGPRRNAPFVVVDASSADGPALEAAFHEAKGGSVFIDDVAELPLPVQTRLLRLLDRQVADLDVRLLVAATRDLDREVEDGNFREDLFHRLAVGQVELPPLRSRLDDVPLLVSEFWRELDRSGAPPPPDLAFHERHRWPGNVRELRNVVTRRFVAGSPIADVEQHVEAPGPREAILESIVEKDLLFSEARERAIAAFERLYITRTLQRHQGNVSKAATVSGLARRYFHRLKARHLR